VRRASLVAEVVATATLLAVFVWAPERGREAFRIFVPVSVAIAIHAIVLDVFAKAPLKVDRRRSHRSGPEVPLKDLRFLEATVAVSPSSARETYHRLRPLIREIAADGLAMRHGIDLDQDPIRARAVLGDDAWELVRTGHPGPPPALARGPDRARLERVVSALEGS
jgi:hypothetical protein